MAINVIVSNVGVAGPAGTNAASEIASTLLLQEDWIASTSAGQNGWTSSSSNGGANSIISAESNKIGICRLSTGGSSAAGYSNIYLGINCVVLGNGRITIEALVRFPTLSTSGERYAARIGLGDALTGDFSYGVWLEYAEATSANWLICSNNNSTATKTASSVAVSENSWVKLKIVIAANGSSAEYFIDGTSIGTISSNLPTSITSPRINITKSVGTSARFTEIDYYQLKYEFSTQR